jgi:hypothetical protein
MLRVLTERMDKMATQSQARHEGLEEELRKERRERREDALRMQQTVTKLTTR